MFTPSRPMPLLPELPPGRTVSTVGTTQQRAAAVPTLPTAPRRTAQLELPLRPRR